MFNEEKDQKTAVVAAWMKEFASIPVKGVSRLHASHIWWKAELLKRLALQKRANAPMEIAERFQFVMGLTSVFALMVWTSLLIFR